MTDVQSERISRTAAHRQAVQIGQRDLVGALVDKLGARLVAYVVDRDRSTISRWASSGELPLEADRALRAVYQVFRLLEPIESDHTIRAWFLGMNPQLDDVSPAEAIRDGRFRDVMAAARAFEVGG